MNEKAGSLLVIKTKMGGVARFQSNEQNRHFKYSTFLKKYTVE